MNIGAWQQLLDFWFGAGFFAQARQQPDSWPDAAAAKRWFNSSKRDDVLIDEQFGELVDEALAGGLEAWEADAESRMALLLLLDQFPRNIFRGSERAFAGDVRASALALAGVEAGMEKTLPVAGQVFFYMPLMHAESREMQARCENCFADLQERAPAALKAAIGNNLKFAREHRAVIEQFGRFPHRNDVLARKSSADELAFLETANRYGQ